MRILILFVILLFGFLQTKACGNEYFFRDDMELPFTNNTFDYYKIFISREKDQHLTNDKPIFNRNQPIPYWYPVSRYGEQHQWNLRDKNFILLKDTMYKILKISTNKVNSDEKIGLMALQQKVDYKLLSDYAWKLAKDGKYKTAQTILASLVLKYPNEYNINANLGTTYELLGKNDLALFYIAKSIKIDPNSHHGSEWLHLNILKEKLGLIQPYMLYGLFNTNKDMRALDTLYKRKADDTKWGDYHRDTLMKHIAYQLHERMFFIGSNDYTMSYMIYIFMQGMIHRKEYEYISDAASLVNRYNNEPYLMHKVFASIKYSLQQLAH